MIKLPTRNVMLFNGLAGVIMLLGFFSVARALVAKPAVLACSQRPAIYGRSFMLNLDRDGEPVRMAEFESDFGGRAFGVADNLRIRGLREGPARAVMAVKLPQGSASPQSSSNPTGGVSMPWIPDDLAGKKAGCLLYHVFVPEHFDFGSGGSLPGIMGGFKDRQEDGTVTEYVARLAWREDGDLTIVAAKTEQDQRRVMTVDGRGAWPKLERGKWVEIQQEFAPNDGTAANGVFRLWLNKKIVIDRNDVRFLLQPNQQMIGVSIDAHFGNELNQKPSPKDQQIFLSPVQLMYVD